PNQYDFDTDEEYNTALNDWLVHRDKVNSNKLSQEKQQEELKAHYENKFNSYRAEREDVSKRLKGYEEAEQVVTQSLPIEKQNLIIAESTKPALVAYALGKNPDLLKQFADAKNPVEVGRILGMIESKVNVVKKPKPKSNVAPSLGNAGTPSSRGLEAALEKARKTGDYTAYRKLKRSLNA
ncbi:MAG: hypothetical protein GY886_09855, partial [Gammaproteobacteria bacterium]|nr:hypothetical protein [Gammaproteobacteria bacterium]